MWKSFDKWVYVALVCVQNTAEAAIPFFCISSTVATSAGDMCDADMVLTRFAVSLVLLFRAKMLRSIMYTMFMTIKNNVYIHL